MSLSLRDRSESNWSLNPQISLRVVLGLMIPGLGLTAALLSLYGYAAWKAVSRRHLDRVSFRLLTYALVANFVYGVSFTMNTLAGYPGWRCSFSSFLVNSSLMFSGCIIFCIALNVPLVVVQNINGQAMEKYYVAGTVLICLICNVPLYASGNLGWDAVSQTCWFNNPDKEARFRWIIGTQISWLFIFAVGEAGAFLIILGYLVRHEFYLIRCPAHTETTYSSEGAGSTILKFRNIILRIGLYPLVSCVLNLTVGVVDLRQSRKYAMEAPEWTKFDVILMLVTVVICAGRPLIYGLLAATDPSFIRALNALRHPDAESLTQFGSRSYCLSTIVDIPPDETCSYDSEALHNDCAQQERMRATQESSTAPERDLGMGKPWWPYIEHDTSVSATRLSISRPAPTLSTIDVDLMCHI
ncbi:hypothetical protein B0H14DRAFT_3899722 [Mycena olivaceomarginata]|nr:hypothetical protein B0H14DRAFT_3899722 [Mycena olivaceomarginata]